MRARIALYRAVATLLWHVARVIEEASSWCVGRSNDIAERLRIAEAPDGRTPVVRSEPTEGNRT